MKKLHLLVPALALGVLTLGNVAFAAPDAPKPGGPEGQPPHPRRVPAIVAALDANHDGVIDATEMANASKALAALDKNNDGRLTEDELHPGARRPSKAMGERADRRGGEGQPPSHRKGAPKGQRPPPPTE